MNMTGNGTEAEGDPYQPRPPDSPSARRVVVFATDENYAPLARGLVLSLAEAGYPGADTDVGMVDTGCSRETLDWFTSHGVRIKAFEAGDRYGFAGAMVLPRYATAQICRPYLPVMFPGYDSYAWLDADMWVQDRVGLEAFFDAVTRFGRVAAVPWLDASYQHHYQSAAQTEAMIRTSYASTYGAQIADEMRGKPMLSSGAFAAHIASPFWKEWQIEIDRLFSAAAANGRQFGHLVEQTAFNYVLLRRDMLIPLDAAHNYHCHSTRPRRNAEGRVVIDVPPYRAVHVVHLSEAPRRMNGYMKSGLLYRRGEYLTEAEEARLRSLTRN